MDEILVANFMVFHDVVEARAVRPVDRRRGLGARLLPAREPRAEAGRVRLADRLRRLAADGRRRRAGGVPDRRLQRRDDRAHRALSARPRPRDLRRRPGRHRPGRASAPACRDPRLDRGALRLRRLRHRLRPGRGSPTGRRFAPSSATATDEQVCIVTRGRLGRRRATCCAGSSPPHPRPRGGCPGCG